MQITSDAPRLRDHDSVHRPIDDVLGDGHGLSGATAYARLSPLARAVWILEQLRATADGAIHLFSQQLMTGDLEAAPLLARLGEVLRPLDDVAADFCRWVAARGARDRRDQTNEPFSSIVNLVGALVVARLGDAVTILAERWPDDLRIELLPPPPPWRDSPRMPRSLLPHFPDITVGFTDAGVRCAVRAPLDQGPSGTISAIAFALWRAGVDDDALARCVTDLVEATRNLPRVAATWISFDGDGGDPSRFDAVTAALYPPHPIEAVLGGPLEPWLGMIRVDASRFDALADPLERCRFVACTATASLTAAEAVRAALRRDPDGVLVRAAALVTEDDVQLLIHGCLAGVVFVVCGSTPLIEAALATEFGRHLRIYDRRS